ncbi:E1-E2 ATPase [Peptoclostridium litorale DSM 5388]|uniref:Copper-exporting P-type ATPase B n=1 Tax=Peptoclostridium litorale DSM 5388 TaxID=1121324 RepID=A0A069RFI5_PEPLI|nr:hypothetical protein [Peptoclostridium litorale]KDR95799.1 copper-exporting P-type ATPase B [Peptoclostridium litorale DSM 5388]SIO21076.1 E1-E2 ATPase [Peptoclostridium litorale DSM 5388]
MQHNHSMHEHGSNKHSHHEEHDHIAHHEMMIEDFKKRFYISIVVTVPILILSPIIQEWFGFKVEFYGSNYILFLLASFLFFYGGWPFLSGLFNELKDKSPGMMTLIAMAITVAYVYSSAVVFGLEGKLFFWELATLIDVMLLGHWIEMKSVVSASNALKKLSELMPDEAHLIKGTVVVDISVSELSEGDVVLIKPGKGGSKIKIKNTIAS